MRLSIFYLLFIIWGFLFCSSPAKKGTLFNKKGSNPTSKKESEEDFFFPDKNSKKKAKVKIDPNKKERAPLEEESFSTENETGFAAWYGKELQGKPTASGEIFDMNKSTGAHRKWSMGSLVLIRNKENDKKAFLKINDRGPYVDGRIIDVSFAVAKKLGFAEKGVANVEIELIEVGKNNFLDKASNKSKNSNFAESIDSLNPEPEENSTSGFSFADNLSPTGYTIQIGAFKSRENAEKYLEIMADEYYQKGFLGIRTGWHYVFLGDFKSSNEAKEFMHNLKEDGVDAMYRGQID